MSRLDVLIKRMSAQRECLNYLIDRLQAQKTKGFVVELGLGSGRSYDHLRENLKDRKVFVFDFRVECHPSCNPPEEDVILGDIEKTLPEFAAKNEGKAAFLHCDIGTKDRERDRRVYAFLTPHLLRLARKEAFFASDRELFSPELEAIPATSTDWPYFMYRRRAP